MLQGGGSSSVGPRKLGKKGDQIALSDPQAHSPVKQFVHRMNSSFSKETTSKKSAANLTNDSNLPTIGQNSSSQMSKNTESFSMKKRSGKF